MEKKKKLHQRAQPLQDLEEELRRWTQTSRSDQIGCQRLKEREDTVRGRPQRQLARPLRLE